MFDSMRRDDEPILPNSNSEFSFKGQESNVKLQDLLVNVNESTDIEAKRSPLPSTYPTVLSIEELKTDYVAPSIEQSKSPKEVMMQSQLFHPRNEPLLPDS